MYNIVILVPYNVAPLLVRFTPHFNTLHIRMCMGVRERSSQPDPAIKFSSIFPAEQTQLKQTEPNTWGDGGWVGGGVRGMGVWAVRGMGGVWVGLGLDMGVVEWGWERWG